MLWTFGALFINWFRSNFMKQTVLCILLLFVTSIVSADTIRILMLGDSLTAGYGIPKEKAYPTLVEERLKRAGYDVKVLNGGVSGSTSASSLSRLNWFLKQKVDVLFLALGANDGLRGLDVTEMKKNLGATIELAKKHGIQVVLGGMKTLPNYGLFYARKFEKTFAQLADEHDIPLLPFLLEGVAGHPKYNLSDGIHPNPAGHKIMADLVYETLEPVIKNTQ